jgi:predicted nuclease of predicted toxin-antitoxin system
MKFLLDENVDLRLDPFLKRQGHSVKSIVQDFPHSLTDTQVLTIARSEQRILLTNDRDFGELIVRQHLSHRGVIYLRLGAYVPLPLLTERLTFVLTRYHHQLDRFLVVTKRRVRVR